MTMLSVTLALSIDLICWIKHDQGNNSHEEYIGSLDLPHFLKVLFLFPIVIHD